MFHAFIAFSDKTLKLCWVINAKHLIFDNLSFIPTSQVLSKVETCISSTKSKQKYLACKKSEFEEQIAKNTKWLDRIKSEMTHLDSDMGAKTQLDQCQSEAQSKLDDVELRRNCQLYKRHIHALEKDAQSTERWACLH